MIKRVNAILFRFLVCVMVFSASMVGQSYADPSGSFEVPEVNDDFTKVNPNQGMQTKKEEDQTTWLGKLLKWTGAAKDQKGLEKLSEQANNEFFDGFIKKSAESLLGYDLYTGEPLKGERKKDADRTLSGVVDCIPVISNIKSFIDFTSGKDTISGDNLDPVDKVITVIGIASGPGKKAGTILKGVLNGGKKFLKRFGIRIDDLAERLGLGPRLQPAGGPLHIPEKTQVNKIEGNHRGGGSGSGGNRKDGFIKVDENKIIQTAMKPKKGGEMVVGHALQKHAGRNPHIWGKVKGGPDQINKMALNHLQEILNGPGEFIKVKNARGIEFLEKKLPDGRGVRLNIDGTFKGFIDQ